MTRKQINKKKTNRISNGYNSKTKTREEEGKKQKNTETDECRNGRRERGRNTGKRRKKGTWIFTPSLANEHTQHKTMRIKNRWGVCGGGTNMKRLAIQVNQSSKIRVEGKPLSAFFPFSLDSG